MNKISFKIVPHRVLPGEHLVQILLDGAVVGAIYPDQQKPGIKIVSVHMAGKEFNPAFEGTVVDDDGSRSLPHIPSLKVVFKVDSTWSLTDDGRVFKHTK